MKNMNAFLCLPLLLTACSERSAAEKAVREALKDPDSAKFGEFYYNAATKNGCLTVNARNTMGGYTGNQQAVLTKHDGGWIVADIADIPQAYCKTYIADVPDKSDPTRNAAADSAQNSAE